MNLLASTFETDIQLIALAGLLVLAFLTGLLWCGVVQLVRIARSLQKIAQGQEKRD